MTEIIIIAISSIGIGFFEGWCSRMSDETAYDDKAHQLREQWMKDAINFVGQSGKFDEKRHGWRATRYEDEKISQIISVWEPDILTRFHIGHPNDAWHWFRRAERYGGYVMSVASAATIGLNWWLVLMVVCHAIAGFVGFRWGSKWKHSFWLQGLAEKWHKRIGKGENA